MSSPRISPPLPSELTVVVPVRDEAPNLGPLIAELDEVLGREMPLVFVDNGSRDGSERILREESLRRGSMTVVALTRAGKQRALMEGFRRCATPWIATMDGDCQDDPRELLRLWEAVRGGGADAAVGVRSERADSYLIKVLPSRVFNRAVSLCFGEKFEDVNSPMKLMRRELVRELDLSPGEYRLLPVIWRSRGFRLSAVNIRQRPRRAGRSKFRGYWRFTEAVLAMMRLRHRIGRLAPNSIRPPSP